MANKSCLPTILHNFRDLHMYYYTYNSLNKAGVISGHHEFIYENCVYRRGVHFNKLSLNAILPATETIASGKCTQIIIPTS